MAMRYNYKTGWCRACEAQRKVQQETTNHALHLILSFLTLGAYSIVWVAIAMAAKVEWRCSECGSLRVCRLADLDESDQTPITGPDPESTDPESKD